jgi:hypothetical protein
MVEAGRIRQLPTWTSKIAYRGDRVFMEYIRIVDGEDEMHVAEVLDIREDKL